MKFPTILTASICFLAPFASAATYRGIYGGQYRTANGIAIISSTLLTSFAAAESGYCFTVKGQSGCVSNSKNVLTTCKKGSCAEEGMPCDTVKGCPTQSRASLGGSTRKRSKLDPRTLKIKSLQDEALNKLRALDE